jgi:hypothetical protein
MRIHRTLPLLFLVLLPATPAFADDKPRPPAVTTLSSTTAAATDRARSLHIEGAKLYEEGKYEQAYVAFVAAWALKKHPQIAGNLADCEMKLGKYRDAAEHYRFITRNASGDVKPEDQRRAEGRLKEAQQKIATVEIATSLAGAEVSVDGVLLGKSPLAEALFLEPGRHTIETRLDGYAPMTQAIDAAAGSSQTVRLEMKSSRLPPSLPPPPRQLAPSLILAGVGVAALATGIGFLVDAGAKGSTADTMNRAILTANHSCVTDAPNHDAQCETLLSTATAARTSNHVGIGFLAGAGAAAVGATLYFLWPTSKPDALSAQGVRVVPSASDTGAGLILSGAF